MNRIMILITLIIPAAVMLLACSSNEGLVMDGNGGKKYDPPLVTKTEDLSTDRPKIIESSSLKYFELRFENNYGSYGLSDKWPSGYYQWKIEKRDGAFVMSVQDTYDSHLEMNYLEEVDEDYILGLADLMADMKLADNNGYYMKDNASDRTYYLNARYESGEELTIRAEGRSADNCVFDIPRLMDYAAIKTDETFQD